ncbi:MAG: glycosyl transferase family 1 [Deltaproteobacteria bacterium HGW-Deltaproteobacteria-15]|jgi:glycosyltransferase involved in cell wall biosynthesis|nr:MAG: glycosyl transferase family 1 [Deltaproteobacteria bacterium HGW-Deltaproteobacteria-15]
MKTPIHRILMSTDSIGGVWTYSIELARALSFFDIEVVLASMGGPLSAEQQSEAMALPNVTLFQSSCKLEWMADPWEDVAGAGKWMLELEAELNPDLIHLNQYALASLPWRSPTIVVGHSCVYSWFRAVRGSYPRNGWQRYRRETAAGLRAAQGVTAPTGAMLRSLLEIYGPFNSCGPIYNGRDRLDFRPGEKTSIVFSAGRLWDEAKNTAALECAAGEIAWPVYVAGETDHPDGGTRCLKNVVHLGRISARAMSKWLGRSSIYVLPARYEPFGLTALEAALSGCALVLGNIPTLREVWKDAAVYVPPERPDVLSAVLNHLIHNPEQITKLARSAAARALRYTPESMAKGYVDLYERILAQTKSTFSHRAHRGAGRKSGRVEITTIP